MTYLLISLASSMNHSTFKVEDGASADSLKEGINQLVQSNRYKPGMRVVDALTYEGKVRELWEKLSQPK